MELTLPDYVKREYPFQSHYFNLEDSQRLHYLDEGSGDVILMLHGNPTWSYYYRHLIKTLSKNYRVIAPDHIGCGLSSKPQDYNYNLSNHIHNVEKLIEKLGIKKFSLVVHDWGGAIGLGLATKYPSRLQKLIILNTAAFTDSLIPKRIQILKNKLGERLIRYFNAFAWPATFMTTTTPLTKEQKKSYLYPYNNYQNRIATAKFVQDIPLSSKDPSWDTLKKIEENIVHIDCPVAIFWGERDFCFTTHFYERWRQLFPQARAKAYPNAGHYVLEDAKEEINHEIAKFLDDV